MARGGENIQSLAACVVFLGYIMAYGVVLGVVEFTIHPLGSPLTFSVTQPQGSVLLPKL